MLKYLKYIASPVTFVIWYVITYYSLLLCLMSMSYLFTLNWFLLIILILLLFYAAYVILNLVPSLIILGLFKFYGLNWFTAISHSLAGLLGVVWFSIYNTINAPTIVTGNDKVYFLIGMWELSPIKTLILLLPYLILFISIVNVSIFVPINLKLSGQLGNEDEEIQKI